MKLQNILDKLGLDRECINIVSASIFDDHSITQLQERIDKNLSLEQTYVLASAISNFYFDEDISNIAPNMVKERKHLSEKRYDHWKVQRVENEERKRAETMIEDQQLYFLEKIQKCS